MPSVTRWRVGEKNQIYLPAYDQVLARHKVELDALRERWIMGEPICLVDYNTNEFVYDVRSPLSHASLIKRHLLGGDSSTQRQKVVDR
jgi:hypothetical protein